MKDCEEEKQQNKEDTKNKIVSNKQSVEKLVKEDMTPASEKETVRL